MGKAGQFLCSKCERWLNFEGVCVDCGYQASTTTIQRIARAVEIIALQCEWNDLRQFESEQSTEKMKILGHRISVMIDQIMEEQRAAGQDPVD